MFGRKEKKEKKFVSKEIPTFSSKCHESLGSVEQSYIRWVGDNKRNILHKWVGATKVILISFFELLYKASYVFANLLFV